MTFLQMQQYCSDLWDDPSNGYFTLPILKMRLNLAAREVQKRLISANKEYYSQCVYTSTVASQKAYALPTDFLQTIRVERVGTGTQPPVYKLAAMTPNERDLYTSQYAAPAGYYFEKNKMILVPTPDAVYEIHLEYSYLIADMVLDADEPDIPLQFHEFVPIIAARDGFIKDGRPLDPIQVKLKEFETLLKQIADQRNADGPRMVVQASSSSQWGD